MERERRKIFRNLEGIRNMSRMPGAMITVDIRRDEIAVREARSKGIPVISIVDTDCDPGMVDIPIPGNDDAYRSIEVILSRLADSIIAGRDKLVAQQAEEAARKASEERKATARPISSGSPMRLIGIRLRTASFSCLSSSRVLLYSGIFMSVVIVPAATTFTLMPWGASSTASCFENMSMDALVEQ